MLFLEDRYTSSFVCTCLAGISGMQRLKAMASTRLDLPLKISVIFGYLPLPFGPTTEEKLAKGPIICVPLNDLKFLSSIEMSL